ncbi:MAG: adenosylmethionine--8-amino-7-oxononanoate transaminase [Candidatus Omnitrophica bacterium]|nr:adenosylmethionine--8-amino-7-oxononanoate transaminase [Candidatus Omnitrophota bacterium]
MPRHRITSNNWIKRDLKYVWHPYTQMKEAEKFPPILIEKAKGAKLFGQDGFAYYDTISSWWCNLHGHNHPQIKNAIKKQLDKLEHVLFAGFTHKPAILLAEKLISIAPGKLSKVFFSDNGSTAVEVALKMSFQYWQNNGQKRKKRFVSLKNAYHGDTVGTMSVSGVDLFNRVFSPLFFPSFKVPSPYCFRCPMKTTRGKCHIDCAKPLEKLLKAKSGQICAIILEPLVMGSGGMIIYPKEYLAQVAKLAKKFKVHLILDEVATGFGRTGKMFACEYVAGIQPDFLCLSKGITAGYLPFAATLTTEKVFRAFYADYAQNKTFFHGHTYTANPLACSAALASLEIFQKQGTLKKINKLIPYFYQQLEKFRALPQVGDVRYLGLIAAFELKGQGRLGLKIYKKGLEQGLLLRPLGNITYLFLPLCINKTELNIILKKVYAIIREI